MTLICEVVLGFWLIVSIAAQLPWKPLTRLRNYDPCGIIPNWSFFAPRPVTFDYHLLYRDQLWDLKLTDWTEIPLVLPRSWWCFVWNPQRRKKKALFDSCSMLVRLLGIFKKQGITNPAAMHRSVPYLMLLNYVSQLPHPNARGTQFVVMRTFGTESKPDQALVFMSQFHAVPEATVRNEPVDFLMASTEID
jgi:hypothetical protein